MRALWSNGTSWKPERQTWRLCWRFRAHWPALLRLKVDGIVVESADLLAWEHQLRGYEWPYLRLTRGIMARTKLSSNGQIVLPKSIRAAHNWEPGTEFIIEESGGCVLLKPVKPFKRTRLEDVLGCADYRGPVKTIEELDEAIAIGTAEQCP